MKEVKNIVVSKASVGRILAKYNIHSYVAKRKPEISEKIDS